MATELTDIELDEVSLVDKGANQEAHVVLVKRSPLRRLVDWALRKNGEYGYGMAPPASPMPMSQVLAEADARDQIVRLLEYDRDRHVGLVDVGVVDREQHGPQGFEIGLAHGSTS